MMPRFRFEDLWRIVASDYLLGVVLLTLALALLSAAWLPQASVGGSTLDVDWQAEVQRRFGDAAWFDVIRSPLQAIGAFNVVDAPGFRLLLALLALSLLARLVDGAEGLWQGRRGGAPPEGASWVRMDARESSLGPAAPRLRTRLALRARLGSDKAVGTNDPPGQVGAGKSSERAFERLVAGLRRRHLRVVIEREGEEVVRADRWPWGELGPVLVYLGGLMALLGVAVTALWGWRVGPLPVTAGESVPLGHESNLTLRLNELTPDGRRGVGEIWHGGDTLVGAGDLSVGRPLVGGDVGAYLVGSGPGLRARATLSEAQTLELVTGSGKEAQEELILTFTEAEPRRLVGVPEADLVLFLAMSPPGQMDVLLQLQVLDSGSGRFVLEQDVPTDTTLTMGGITFVFASIPYAEIRLVRDPGAFWSQLGVIWLVAGMFLWGLWPPRRLWLRRSAGSAGSVGGVEVAGDVGLLSALGLGPAQPSGGEV